MTHQSIPPRFIPLNPISQASSENILYYDSNVSLDAIYDCITNRLQATIMLFETIHEIKTIPYNALSAVCIVSNILLNDCAVLFEELSPVALQLREPN